MQLNNNTKQITIFHIIMNAEPRLYWNFFWKADILTVPSVVDI